MQATKKCTLEKWESDAPDLLCGCNSPAAKHLLRLN